MVRILQSSVPWVRTLRHLLHIVLIRRQSVSQPLLPEAIRRYSNCYFSSSANPNSCSCPVLPEVRPRVKKESKETQARPDQARLAISPRTLGAGSVVCSAHQAPFCLDCVSSLPLDRHFFLSFFPSFFLSSQSAALANQASMIQYGVHRCCTTCTHTPGGSLSTISLDRLNGRNSVPVLHDVTLIPRLRKLRRQTRYYLLCTSRKRKRSAFFYSCLN